MATKVYGASDDLIEFDGDVTGEVGHFGTDDNERGDLIIFSDGTLLEIKYGKADLFMGYIDKTGKSTPEVWQDYFIEFLKKGSENYFGYVVTRYDPDSVHIWQAYIKEEYQHTNAMVEGFRFIENAMKRYSVPYMTFSSPRAGWGKVCEKLGFSEIYTIYRKKIER